MEWVKVSMCYGCFTSHLCVKSVLGHLLSLKVVQKLGKIILS